MEYAIGTIVGLCKTSILAEVTYVDEEGGLTLREAPTFKNVKPESTFRVRPEDVFHVLNPDVRIKSEVYVSAREVTDFIERTAPRTDPVKTAQMLGYCAGMRFATGNMMPYLPQIANVLELPEILNKFNLNIEPLIPTVSVYDFEREFKVWFGGDMLLRFVALIACRQIIPCIKEIRNLTGTDLRTAKNFVEWAQGVKR